MGAPRKAASQASDLEDVEEMKMHCVRIAALFVALVGSLLAGLVSAASAQEAGKTFAVTPFKIMGPDNYAYLGPAIQSMLASRLTWRGHFDPIEPSGVAGAGVPTAAAQAREALQKLGTDYLVFGSATIVGEDVSLDVQVVDAAGNHWPKSSSVKLSALIPAMEGVAQSINAEVFKRPGADAKAAAVQGQPRQQVQMMNPDLVYNEQDARQDFFLNPYFRQQETPDQSGRWRSQTLPVQAASMVIDDLDGDGVNEIVLLEDGKLNVYSIHSGRMDLQASIEVPSRVRSLRVNTFELGMVSRNNIIITGLADEYEETRRRDGTPWSAVLAYDGGRLQYVQENIPLFMDAVQVPPYYRKMLFCQRKGNNHPLDGTVHEVIVSNGQIQPGVRVNLPAYGNIFNFGYMPTQDGEMILVVDDFDRIRVNTATGRFVAQTGDEYANSPVGFNYAKRVAGLGASQSSETNKYWISGRLLLAKLADKNKYELIVGRNISKAANIFANYRDFPFGEVHSLYWDGVGLSLIWKTRQFKGTVVDYAVADIDNDGNKELCVLLHTYSGTAGLSSRRSVIEAFKLSLEPTPENAQPQAQ